MEIVGYENYLIYPDGKVYSKKSKRYLKHTDDGNGYYRISLSKDGIVKKHRIHRLVGLHYIPNPDNKRFLDHINRDRKDNRIENLRWVDKSENGLNRGEQINNKLGIKNIHYDKLQDRFIYQKKLRGEPHRKYFKTLEEAIAYKEEYELSLDNESRRQ